MTYDTLGVVVNSDLILVDSVSCNSTRLDCRLLGLSDRSQASVRGVFNGVVVRNWGFSLLIIMRPRALSTFGAFIVLVVATIGVEAVFVVVVDSELVFTPTLWAVVVSEELTYRAGLSSSGVTSAR